MRILKLSLILLLLTGCSTAIKVQHPLVVSQTKLGIYVDIQNQLDLDLIDQRYEFISWCTVNKFIEPNVMVIVTERNLYYKNRRAEGLSILYTELMPRVYIYNNTKDLIQVLDHEFIHVILNEIGFSKKLNEEHKHKAFKECLT